MGTKKKDALVQFNRENIVTSAKRLFQNKGVNQTTMDDIAKEADYSKSTIYVYFKSKDEIYKTIVCEYMLLFKEIIKSCIIENEKFEDCYYAICNAMVSFQEEYPLYFESLLGEIIATNTELDEGGAIVDIYRVGEETNVMMGELLEQAIANNQMKQNLEVFPTIFYLWGSLGGLIKLASQKATYFKIRADLDKSDFLQYSFKMILASIKNEEKSI